MKLVLDQKPRPAGGIRGNAIASISTYGQTRPRRMKFLVIDDHELIREAMRGALTQLESDAEIFEASDGAQAIALVEQHPDLDLIMLDLNLPDRDGFSMLVELRRNHPGISVVVMSAQQDQDS